MLHAFRTLFGIDDELLTPVTERERTRMVRALGTEAAVASHLRGRAPRVGRRIWILGGEHVVCLAASDRHVVGCHPVASIRSVATQKGYFGASIEIEGEAFREILLAADVASCDRFVAALVAAHPELVAPPPLQIPEEAATVAPNLATRVASIASPSAADDAARELDELLRRGLLSEEAHRELQARLRRG